MGKVKGETKVGGLLHEELEDDGTATTAMLTDVDEMFSDSDAESDEGEDFAAENAPRPPPETLMYGGNGESSPEGRGVAQVGRPGRSHSGEGSGAAVERHGAQGKQADTECPPAIRGAVAAAERHGAGSVAAEERHGAQGNQAALRRPIEPHQAAAAKKRAPTIRGSVSAREAARCWLRGRRGAARGPG